MTAATRSATVDPHDAVRAQIEEVRAALRRDAASVGIAAAAVDAEMDTCTAHYADARVHAFIGVLVEREVRRRLGLIGVRAARSRPR